MASTQHISLPAPLSKGVLRCVWVVSVILLAGCKTPGLPFLGDSTESNMLAPGQSQSMHFLTREPNFDSNIGLAAGATYELEIAYLSNWVDENIDSSEAGEPLNELGFGNERMPLQQLGATRRSRTHNWFELMLFQPDCRGDSLKGISELQNAAGSYRFTASCDGDLHLFVNDTPGFYMNNQGYANLSLTRLP